MWLFLEAYIHNALRFGQLYVLKVYLSQFSFILMSILGITQRCYKILLTDGMWAEQTAFFWFQQDRARPNRSRDIFFFLWQFGNQVIALDFKKYFERDMNWPPYSQDLKSCDFFL